MDDSNIEWCRRKSDRLSAKSNHNKFHAFRKRKDRSACDKQVRNSNYEPPVPVDEIPEWARCSKCKWALTSPFVEFTMPHSSNLTRLERDLGIVDMLPRNPLQRGKRPPTTS